MSGRDLSITVSSSLAALALFALYCFAWLYLPPGYDQNSFLASIIDKHRALDQAGSPKIVFVGGSNLALGLDSDAVQKATGRPVVNMGVSRLFGLRYCLEEVKDSIHAGDVIVIAPEFENFFGDMNGSSYLMNVAILMPRAIPWIVGAYSSSPERAWELGSHVSGVLNFKWNWWRKHCGEFAANPHAVPLFNLGEAPGFSRQNFTRNGDFVGHLARKPPEWKYMQLCQDCGTGRIDPESVRVLNAFYQFARSRDVCVVLLPPPLPKYVYRDNKKAIDGLYEFCKENLDFPILGRPDRYLFTYDCFYNSLYHLRAQARQQRTAMILEDLSEQAETASLIKPSSL
jgi:hypothetical protein